MNPILNDKLLYYTIGLITGVNNKRNIGKKNVLLWSKK